MDDHHTEHNFFTQPQHTRIHTNIQLLLSSDENVKISTWISCWLTWRGWIPHRARRSSRQQMLLIFIINARCSLLFFKGDEDNFYEGLSTRHHFLPTSRGYQYSRLLIPPTLARLVRERARAEMKTTFISLKRAYSPTLALFKREMTISLSVPLLWMAASTWKFSPSAPAIPIKLIAPCKTVGRSIYQFSAYARQSRS